MEQFYLTLPHQPFLLVYYKYSNNSGKFQKFIFNNRIYPKPTDEIRNIIVSTEKSDYFPGENMNYTEFEDKLSITSTDDEMKLNFLPLGISQKHYLYYLMNDAFNFGGNTHKKIEIENKGEINIPISLLLFDKEIHSKKEVSDFNLLKFE